MLNLAIEFRFVRNTETYSNESRRADVFTQSGP